MGDTMESHPGSEKSTSVGTSGRQHLSVALLTPVSMYGASTPSSVSSNTTHTSSDSMGNMEKPTIPQLMNSTTANDATIASLNATPELADMIVANETGAPWNSTAWSHAADTSTS